MIEAIVLSNRRYDDYFVLSLKSTKYFEGLVGQFVMVSLPTDFSLPKPFSLLSKNGNQFELLIKKVGPLTEKLSNLKSGDKVLFRGGYGKSFLEKLDMRKRYFLIGGGSGSAPLIYFFNSYPNMVQNAFFGFKDDGISRILRLSKVFGELQTGRNILQIAAPYIDLYDNGKYGIIACGNTDMLLSIRKTFKKFKIYASFEERMGCGIGMCMGCPIKTTNGMKKVCKDGPIFDLDEVILEW